MQNAKELLLELQHMESMVSAKKHRLNGLRILSTSIKALNMNGMPRNPSPEQSSLATVVEKIVDLEWEITRDEAAVLKKKERLIDLIGTIDNPEYQKVLLLRYINQYSWEQIAKELSYSERWIYKMHRLGLDAMDCTINNNYCKKEDSSVQ